MDLERKKLRQLMNQFLKKKNKVKILTKYQKLMKTKTQLLEAKNSYKKKLKKSSLLPKSHLRKKNLLLKKSKIRNLKLKIQNLIPVK